MKEKKTLMNFLPSVFPDLGFLTKKSFQEKKLEEMISSRNPSKEGKLERLLFLRKGGF